MATSKCTIVHDEWSSLERPVASSLIHSLSKGETVTKKSLPKIFITPIGDLLGNAMSRCENVFIVDEGTAAELSARVEERRDPRPLAGVSILTAHDPFLILVTVLRPALRRVDAGNGTGRFLAGRRRGHGGRARPPAGFLRRPGRRDAGFLRRGNWFDRRDRWQFNERRMSGQRWYRVIGRMSRYRRWPGTQTRRLRSWFHVRSLLLVLIVALQRRESVEISVERNRD